MKNHRLMAMMHVMKCLSHTQHIICICAVAIAQDKKLVILCCHTCRCMTGSPVSMTIAALEPPPLDGKLTCLSVQTSVCSLPAVSQEPAGPPQVKQPPQSLPLHTQSSAIASAASGQTQSTHMPAAQQSASATRNAWTDRLPQTLPLPWPLWKRSNSPSPTDPSSTTQNEWSSASVSASASSPQHGPGSLSGDVRDACRLSQGLESSASPAAAAAAPDIQGLIADPHPAPQDEEDNEPCSQTPAEATTHMRASSANSIVEGAVADSSTEPGSVSEVSPASGSRIADAAPDVASSGSAGQVVAAADAMAHVTADLGTSGSADCMSSVPVRGGKPGKLGAAEAHVLTLEQKALLIKGLQLSKQVQQVCCTSPELRPTLFLLVSTMTLNKKFCFWFEPFGFDHLVLTIRCQCRFSRRRTCCTA